MKSFICTALGAIGAGIAAAFGGWSAALTTLIIFMAIDYISGLILAGVFHRSSKSESGALESKAGWKGLCRKGLTLLIVVVASRLDVMLGTTFVKDAVCIAYICNEAISILENAGMMGVPIPKAVKNAIEILKKKGE